MKIAYFDFCETLIKFQTADLFIDFVRKKKGSGFMNGLENLRQFLVRSKFFALISLFHKKNNLHKRLKLYQLKGLKRDLLDTYAEEYYQEVLKPHIIQKVLAEMTCLKNKGYSIVVVSGGYSLYIDKFVKDFCLDHGISTNIDFDKKGNCKGLIDGYDCMGPNKLVMIKNSDFGRVGKHRTIAFSDSISDIPLLNYAENGVVVSKGKKQKWAMENGFAEIIWI